MRVRYETKNTADKTEWGVIDNGLDEFNKANSSLQDVKSMFVLGRDDSDEIVCGAIGRSWGKCCELQIIWVRDDLRGSGLGQKVMDAAEEEARQRGCNLMYLETFSFQAPEFYLRLGYEVRAEFEGFPEGSKFIFAKTF